MSNVTKGTPFKSFKVAVIAPLHESLSLEKGDYGGTERVVVLLTKHLLRFGHSVTLCGSGDSPVAQALSEKYSKQFRFAPIVPKSLRAAGFPGGAARELESLLRYSDLPRICEGADIVSNHFLHIAPFLPHLLGDMPRMTTVHGAPNLSPDKETLELAPEEPFVSISYAQQRVYPKVNWISTVYNGIEDGLTYRPKPLWNKWWDGDKPYLLFLGRISPEKGLDLAIRAALKAGRKLVIAAKLDRNEKDLEYFEKSVEPLLDNRQIVWIGETKGFGMKNRLLGGAEALLFPSVWPEPFGLVQGEAWACGLPEIAIHFRNSSVRELVSKKGCGIAIPYSTSKTAMIEGMADAIQNIHRISRARCRQHSLSFTGEAMAQRYIRAFRKAIAAKSKKTERPAKMLLEAIS
jgi:glycosyltransferase involved in cell wall biosynthesis